MRALNTYLLIILLNPATGAVGAGATAMCVCWDVVGGGTGIVGKRALIEVVADELATVTTAPPLSCVVDGPFGILTKQIF